MKKKNDFIVRKNINLKNALIKLQKNEIKIICYLNNKNELIGVINDGDIRRALLKYNNLNIDIEKVINTNFVYGTMGISNYKIISLMKKYSVDYLPILKKKKLIELKSINDYVPNVDSYSVSINVMAGGLGKRLRPFTNNLHKCLVNVGKKNKIIDLVLKNLLKLNFKNLNFFLCHRKNQVRTYINQMYKFLSPNFILEKKPLGTIGGLSLLANKQKSDLMLLINSDIICNIDYEKLIKFHQSNKSDFTIVTTKKEIKLKYGLLKNLDLNLETIDEKPSISFNINSGIYLFNQNCLSYLKNEKFMDAVTFIKLLKKKRKKIISYAIYENWFDLGTPKDLLDYKKFYKLHNEN